jgi:hypothetical protein
MFAINRNFEEFSCSVLRWSIFFKSDLDTRVGKVYVKEATEHTESIKFEVGLEFIQHRE